MAKRNIHDFNKLGDTLRVLRTVKKLKSKEMAEKLSVSSSYFSEIETCKKNLTFELFHRFCLFLDMQPWEVLKAHADLQAGESITFKLNRGTDEEVLRQTRD